MAARAHLRPWKAAALGRGALQRALLEHTLTLGADCPLHFVRNAKPLKQHIRAHTRVPVEPPAWREELTHRPLSERSYPVGKYDAQKGDEVVTMCRRVPPAAKLGRVRHRRLRLLLSLPLVGFLAGCGATAQQVSSAQRPQQSAGAHCRSGASGVGNRQVTVAAVVRRQARAYRRPAGPAFARFDRLNQNGVPTVFRVLSLIYI